MRRGIAVCDRSTQRRGEWSNVPESVRTARLVTSDAQKHPSVETPTELQRMCNASKDPARMRINHGVLLSGMGRHTEADNFKLGFRLRAQLRIAKFSGTDSNAPALYRPCGLSLKEAPNMTWLTKSVAYFGPNPYRLAGLPLTQPCGAKDRAALNKADFHHLVAVGKWVAVLSQHLVRPVRLGMAD
eukprot:2952859-Amphidinium_carterae.1